MTDTAAALMLLLIGGACAQVQYFGKELGALTQLHHGVRGTVYVVDSRTLYIKDFHYDGEGPAAYFYVGATGSPGAGVTGATRLRDERGGVAPLRRYRGESITLSLPDGKTLKDFRWFSVYCDEYSVNFGDVSLPRSLEPPRPAKLGALRGVHGVSSDSIVVVDAQTLLVPNFSYDGEAPDAKFWVGRGDKPSPQGIRIPDENGKETPLRKYDKKTIVLTLPGELTVFDIGHFAVWCEAFTVNFGHVPLPASALANVPPSLKMLGVSPQSKLNCEVLLDELAFEVRWAVAGDSIVVQLVSKLEDGEYMTFGLSGDNAHSQMVGGDVAVAWVDKDTLKGHAVDYYLDAKSQCAGVRGSCPDERLGEKTNSIRLLNAALVNGYSIVTYQRSLKAADQLDRPIFTNMSQPIIWAIGPLNSRNEVSYHSQYTKGDKFLEFGRPPVWNCPMPEGDEDAHKQNMPAHVHTDATTVIPVKQQEHVIKPNPVPTPKPAAKVTPWEIPGIQCDEPPDGVFYAQMGPTGGKHGYPAITGHVGWGISWYINGLLIPEINVVRGRKYTFVVEGGADPNVPARYHPFYITNDPVGGYLHKLENEKQGIEIYAGVRRSRSGELTPTGVGRLCNWTPDTAGPEADEYPSFGAYQRSLTLVCEAGTPGVVTWVPDKNTPDVVYYQCFTHRHLGWKINVLDECDVAEAEESRLQEQLALPDELVGEESVQVQSRLAPNRNFLDQRRKIQKLIKNKPHYNDFSSFEGEDVLTGEVFPPGTNPAPNTKDFELPLMNAQIEDAIQTVESLEAKMKKNNTQYLVHEDFMQEQPIREGDEYFFESEKTPESYFMPPNQKPLTLQSVLRPTNNQVPNKPHNHSRPPFRRPAPPEIKLRRNPPYQKGSVGYPLPMPNHHPIAYNTAPKKPMPNKYSPNRPTGNNQQSGMNRFPLPNVPPMKTMPPMKNMPPTKIMPPVHHQNRPIFNQMPSAPKQSLKAPNAPVQNIIMGKPVNPQGSLTVPKPQGQTLNLGQTDIIANQVVKSQITLPGANDAVAQHSIGQVYFQKPGQIILGKPMDNPLPLDQQMIPTKQFDIRTKGTTPEPIYRPPPPSHVEKDIESPSLNKIESSDFIGESIDSSTFHPAVNTGFKPDSIVVESGFKPIIREPLMASEDRITNDGNNNRREDTNVEDTYDEPAPQAQHVSNNHAISISSEKLTETFEPMFIPSPPDHMLPTDDKTKEVFPNNHAKEDRPHPVYVKTESELNALFSKKNMEKNIPSDLVMESDRISPHYLPPDPKLPKEHSQKLSSDQTFTTYDGKTVSAATLTSVPSGSTPANMKIFSSKLPANTELLLRTPQFGPFKGEIPPLIADHMLKESQSQSSGADVKVTQLRHIDSKPEDKVVSDLSADGSENINAIAKQDASEKDAQADENDEEYDDDDDDDDEIEEEEERVKRDTKTTQFERGEIEEVQQINGHSMPRSQMEFEEERMPISAASSSRLSWLSHIVLLMLCIQLL